MLKHIAVVAVIVAVSAGSTALLAQGQSTPASRLAMAVEHDIKCGFADHPRCNDPDDPNVKRVRVQAEVRRAAAVDLKCGFGQYQPCQPPGRRQQQSLSSGNFDLAQYMIELGRLQQRFERGELTLGQFIEASGQLQQQFQ